MKSKRIAIGAAWVVLGAGAWFWLSSPESRVAGVRDPSPPSAASPSLPETPASPAAAPSVGVSAAKPRRENRTDHRVAWAGFQTRFGSGLQPSFSAEGRLVSVRGKLRGSNPSSTRFDPNDPQLSIGRAREILESAHALLGLQREFPLERPVARTGGVSAQVFWKQTHQGVPVAPQGNVTIDLGPKGELLSMDSDYVPGIRVTNQVRLKVDEARERALAAMPEKSESKKVEGGSVLVWVSSPGENPVGRYAFDFLIRGRRVVVDAESGEILANQDRRVF